MGRPKRYTRQLHNVMVDEATAATIEAEYERRRQAAGGLAPEPTRSDVIRDFLGIGGLLADSVAEQRTVSVLVDGESVYESPTQWGDVWEPSDEDEPDPSVESQEKSPTAPLSRAELDEQVTRAGFAGPAPDRVEVTFSDPGMDPRWGGAGAPVAVDWPGRRP